MTDFFRFTSQHAADRQAAEWFEKLDHNEKVGARHHIVPLMILRRFSDSKGQLYVRDRSTGEGRIGKAEDLAVRDFYTVVTKDGKLDSSLESLYSEVEGAAATILRAHLDTDAFARPRPFTLEERFKIDAFVAMQATRGMRGRRAYELLADYGIKLLNQQHLTPEDIETSTFIPHPNEYIKISNQLAERTHEALASRPLALIKLDRPLFIIGDEPVVLFRESPLPAADPRGYPKISAPGIDPKDVIQFQAEGGVGMGNADAVAMPISPRAAIVYGALGSGSVQAPERFSGKEAESAAAGLNEAVINAALNWVAAHPDHPSFKRMKFSAPRPLLRVIDGGSDIAKRTNADTTRRPIRRVKRTDVDDVPELKSTPPEAEDPYPHTR